MSAKENLIRLLGDVKGKLEDNAFSSETAVSMFIVLPVLQHLGWDTSNPREVWPEYSLEGTRADFALMAEDKPQVIIEVKHMDHGLDAEPQLFEYVFKAGAKMAVLTNGREWRLYLAFVASAAADKLFQTIDITEHDLDDAAFHLRRYLRKSEIISGRAVKSAERNVEEQTNKNKARQAIPDAWQTLTTHADSPIVKAIIHEVSAQSGYIPDTDDVIGFLSGRADLGSAPALAENPTPALSQNPKPRRGWYAPTYILFGRAYAAENEKEAYVEILTKLRERDPSFPERVAPHVEYQNVRELARNRRAISKRGVEQTIKAARSIGGGWWAHCNMVHKAKYNSLKHMCELENIPFGKPEGLKVDFYGVKG